MDAVVVLCPDDRYNLAIRRHSCHVGCCFPWTVRVGWRDERWAPQARLGDGRRQTWTGVQRAAGKNRGRCHVWAYNYVTSLRPKYHSSITRESWPQSSSFRKFFFLEKEKEWNLCRVFKIICIGTHRCYMISPTHVCAPIFVTAFGDGSAHGGGDSCQTLLLAWRYYFFPCFWLVKHTTQHMQSSTLDRLHAIRTCYMYVQAAKLSAKA